MIRNIYRLARENPFWILVDGKPKYINIHENTNIFVVRRTCQKVQNFKMQNIRMDKVLGLGRIQWEQLESTNNQLILLLNPEGNEVSDF